MATPATRRAAALVFLLIAALAASAAPLPAPVGGRRALAGRPGEYGGGANTLALFEVALATTQATGMLADKPGPAPAPEKPLVDFGLGGSDPRKKGWLQGAPQKQTLPWPGLLG